MLCHEYDIENHTEIPKHEFERITCDAAPVFLQARVQHQLSDRENASNEV